MSYDPQDDQEYELCYTCGVKAAVYNEMPDHSTYVCEHCGSTELIDTFERK